MKKLLFSFSLITTLLLGIFVGFNSIDIGDKQPVLPEPIEDKEVKNISILAVGDIMFHMPQVYGARLGQNSYDFNDSFKYVKKYIEDSDIAIANFETVVAGNHKGFSGFPRFNSPIETVEALENAGFDILSTANNHSIDQGVEGIISTIDRIEENGMKNIGTYRDERRDGLIKDENGIKLGFLSYTYGLNGLEALLPRDKSYMVNLIDEELIKEDIAKLREEDVDLTIVFIHWGKEYKRQASDYQKELGRKMLSWGADIILGSHPHVIQETEVINHEGKDKYIIYSMGNFLSNQRRETIENPYTEDGVMVLLSIEKIDDNTNINSIEYIPTWIHRYSKGNRYAYEILPVEDMLKDENYISVRNRLQRSMDDTLGIMSMED